MAYRYDYENAGLPYLNALVRSFDVRPATGALLAHMLQVYPDLRHGDDIAMIGLDVVDRVGG